MTSAGTPVAKEGLGRAAGPWGPSLVCTCRKSQPALAVTSLSHTTGATSAADVCPGAEVRPQVQPCQAPGKDRLRSLLHTVAPRGGCWGGSQQKRDGPGPGGSGAASPAAGPQACPLLLIPPTPPPGSRLDAMANARLLPLTLTGPPGQAGLSPIFPMRFRAQDITGITGWAGRGHWQPVAPLSLVAATVAHHSALSV